MLRIKIIFFFRRLLARAVASGSAADKVSSQRKLQEMDFPRLIGAPNDFRVERRCGAAALRRHAGAGRGRCARTAAGAVDDLMDTMPTHLDGPGGAGGVNTRNMKQH